MGTLTTTDAVRSDKFRDGRQPTPAEFADDLLRTPSVTDSTGGAISETQARERGRMVKIADQAAELAYNNGLQVSESIAESLLPTPTLGHIRNYDEPIEDYLERREKADSGEYRGMPGISLGVAVRMEMFPTPNTMDGLPPRSPEKIAESKERTPGGYANLRESVVNDLLPTPAARDFKDGSADHERDGVVQTDTVARAIFSSGEVLLPTTTASDWKGANHSGSESASASSISTIASDLSLLPTTTTNGNERKSPGYSSAGILQELEITNGILPKEYPDWDTAATKVSSIPDEKSDKTKLDAEITWGKFEPAIRRWESVLGRPAPAPTKPDGKDGNHRLSSAFTEWMMGLPEGWITDAGLTRNEELKACGNGVVPQQAEYALRILLQGVNF